MPQVARETVKERARRLRTQGEAALARHLDREIGAVRRVLAETNEGGHTEHFTPVQFDDVVEPGRIVEARMIRHDGRRLVAASRERTERCRATDRVTIS
jgi:threonylcarbamoyladenosine tRNA methylthiotransferase MtaB